MVVWSFPVFSVHPPPHRWCFLMRSYTNWGKPSWHHTAMMKSEIRCRHSGNHKITCKTRLWMCVSENSELFYHCYFIQQHVFFENIWLCCSSVSVVWFMSQLLAVCNTTSSLSYCLFPSQSSLSWYFFSLGPLLYFSSHSLHPLLLHLLTFFIYVTHVLVLPLCHVFQSPCLSGLMRPWTTSPPPWAKWLSSSAACRGTHRPSCAGWRTTPPLCRSRGASPTGPRRTAHAYASATWTPRTRATSSAWPPTTRARCPRRACCLSNSVRERFGEVRAAFDLKALERRLVCRCHSELALWWIFSYFLWQTMTYFFFSDVFLLEIWLLLATLISADSCL